MDYIVFLQADVSIHLKDKPDEHDFQSIFTSAHSWWFCWAAIGNAKYNKTKRRQKSQTNRKNIFYFHADSGNFIACPFLSSPELLDVYKRQHTDKFVLDKHSCRKQFSRASYILP